MPTSNAVESNNTSDSTRYITRIRTMRSKRAKANNTLKQLMPSSIKCIPIHIILLANITTSRQQHKYKTQLCGHQYQPSGIPAKEKFGQER